MENKQNSWDCLSQTLPYWCVLQALGHEGVITRLRHSMNLSKLVNDTISKQRPFLKLIVNIFFFFNQDYSGFFLGSKRRSK
jgi:hypothetical protein